MAELPREECAMRRRSFLKSGLASAALLAAAGRGATTPLPRPNILWLSAEDISPDLGCYGDGYATTPHIDALARKSVRYDRAYSHSGVCAPSRSGIITGMYPTAIGTHHMRCSGVPPAGVKCFPEYLRAAGYYCTNNRKTDYQFEAPRSAWDESSDRAHWRNRPQGTPFFSVVNFTVCHESQVRSRAPELLARIEALGDDRHDPAEVDLPPYHADTPATRRDWAQYYDVITLMDKEVGQVLAELDGEGLAEDTIVWFWGDHGRGLTRGKRWLYESGTRIPLLIHVPEKWRDWVRPGDPSSLAGGTRDDLVSFIDFAPAMLSLAGVPIPEHMQGQAFLGREERPPRTYVYGARDRMDETYDLIRAVRDKRFRYLRNYMPYVSYAQEIEYMDLMPMAQDLRRLHREGQLDEAQARWFAPRKPLEELYDVDADPHEVNNLAEAPAYREDLLRLRRAHETWMADTGDVGLIPEPIYDEWKWGRGTLTVSAPTLGETDGHFAMATSTPGASISYRWEDDPKGHWRLYTEPVPRREGLDLRAKATRIGFDDSPEVTGVTKAVDLAERAGAAHPADTPLSAELLARLRALRSHDGRANESVDVYLDALEDTDPSMRYWAAVLLHRWVDPELHRPDWTEAIAARLGDESVAVRIAAAHALCDWGREGLPVLEAALAGEGQAARLFAATALAELGDDKARPARPALMKCALEDPWDNVVKVARRALGPLSGQLP